MEIKIIRKSGCAIICSLCFIALCMPFIDIHNDMESTIGWIRIWKGETCGVMKNTLN